MILEHKLILLQLSLIYVSSVLSQVVKGPLIWSNEFNYNGPPDPSTWDVWVKGDNYNGEV